MDRHAQLIKTVKDSIDELFRDSSVPEQTTRVDLEEIAEYLKDLIAVLPSDPHPEWESPEAYDPHSRYRPDTE